MGDHMGTLVEGCVDFERTSADGSEGLWSKAKKW